MLKFQCEKCKQITYSSGNYNDKCFKCGGKVVEIKWTREDSVVKK